MTNRWENIKEYFISVYNELKKVHWPDRRQLTGYTGVVLVSVFIVGLIIWLFDSGLSWAMTKLFEAVGV
ncbi:MAG: preprotein translocase subunit SecE [Syntrophomonadaceae bacterium]|nr:preprotein translocase subunit SecE [Syntrophomonadaceae bacterium]